MERENTSASEESHNSQVCSDSPDDRPGMPIHTYTPQSHENLLKQFSKMSFNEDEVKMLKREINHLKVELKKTCVELQLKEDRINILENKLLTNILGSENPSTLSEARSAHFQDKSSNVMENKGSIHSGEILSQHFSEITRRHQETLEQKEKQIRELQAVLRQCQVGDQHKDASEEQATLLDFSDTSVNTNLEKDAKNNTPVGGSCRKKNEVQANNVESFFIKPPYTTTRKEQGDPTYHGAMSDIEQIRQYFLEKLDIEQELDVLYWQMEQKRYLMLQNNSEYDYDQRRAYEKEFEMFRKTRDNILTDLSTMRDEYNKNAIAKVLEHQVHFTDGY